MLKSLIIEAPELLGYKNFKNTLSRENYEFSKCCPRWCTV